MFTKNTLIATFSLVYIVKDTFWVSEIKLSNRDCRSLPAMTDDMLNDSGMIMCQQRVNNIYMIE